MEKNAKAMWDDAKNSMPSMDDVRIVNWSISIFINLLTSAYSSANSYVIFFQGGGDGVKKTINKKWSEGVDSVRKLFSWR